MIRHPDLVLRDGIVGMSAVGALVEKGREAILDDRKSVIDLGCRNMRELGAADYVADSWKAAMYDAAGIKETTP